MTSPTDAVPSTKTKSVRAVATVVRLLGTFTWPAPGDTPVPAVVSRDRIQAIDFYPTNPTTNPERKTA